MVSRLARRSGVAVVQIAELLQWTPEVVFHVGVGVQHAEVFIMRNECWPQVRIVGFEPNPVTFQQVKDQYPGELHWKALGNQSGTATLYQPDRHRDGSSLFRRTPSDQEFAVPIQPLDALYPSGPGGTCLLWIDAEGNDLDVLRGGERFIDHVEMINIEMTGTPVAGGWNDQREIDQWLRQHGFRRQWVHTQRIHVGQQDCIYVRDAIFDPTICPCPCQLEGFEPKACEGVLLPFFEVVVHRDLRTTVRQGGRRIGARESFVRKECSFRTQRDDPKQRRHYWRLRWCGYAVDAGTAEAEAVAAAQMVLDGAPPDWIDMGKN